MKLIFCYTQRIIKYHKKASPRTHRAQETNTQAARQAANISSCHERHTLPSPIKEQRMGARSNQRWSKEQSGPRHLRMCMTDAALAAQTKQHTKTHTVWLHADQHNQLHCSMIQLPNCPASSSSSCCRGPAFNATFGICAFSCHQIQYILQKGVFITRLAAPDVQPSPYLACFRHYMNSERQYLVLWMRQSTEFNPPAGTCGSTQQPVSKRIISAAIPA